MSQARDIATTWKSTLLLRRRQIYLFILTKSEINIFSFFLSLTVLCTRARVSIRFDSTERATQQQHQTSFTKYDGSSRRSTSMSSIILEKVVFVGRWKNSRNEFRFHIKC